MQEIVRMSEIYLLPSPLGEYGGLNNNLFDGKRLDRKVTVPSRGIRYLNSTVSVSNAWRTPCFRPLAGSRYLNV